jgi:hypothetical protein
VHVNVRSVGVGRVEVCMLCACDSEEREHGVGTGVNATMLLERIGIISLAESAARAFQLRGKPMNLCACDSEERERGVGAGVNATMLSERIGIIFSFII